MWNPLRLPLAALGIVVDVARALTELPGILAGLEARLDQQGQAVLSELERLGGVVERLTEQVAVLLAEVEALREEKGDSAGLQDQLERTQAELAAANREIGRMIETAGATEPAQPAEPAEPAQPATPRRGRFASAFRRSSPTA